MVSPKVLIRHLRTKNTPVSLKSQIWAKKISEKVAGCSAIACGGIAARHLPQGGAASMKTLTTSLADVGNHPTLYLFNNQGIPDSGIRVSLMPVDMFWFMPDIISS